MPLDLYGSFMDGIRIEFERGRAVKADADTGADALRATLAKDDGASRLGEIASSTRRAGSARSAPSSASTTLLDENAASHIALGGAYTFPVDDEAERERQQEQHPRRLHDRLERSRRRRDHAGRRPSPRPPRGSCRSSSSRLADRDGLELLAGAFGSAAEVVQAGQRGRALELEDRSKSGVVR